MIEKHKFDFSNLVESERSYISALKVGLLNKVSVQEMQEILDSREGKFLNSIVSSIEYDIKGFYEIGQTLTSSIVLVEKFRNNTRDQIFNLLMDRIISIRDGLSEVPERLFKLLITRLHFNERMIGVIVVQQQPHDYILFKSPYYKEEYFIRLFYEWRAFGPEVVKLRNEDSRKVEFMTEDEIVTMIKDYRKQS